MRHSSFEKTRSFLSENSLQHIADILPKFDYFACGTFLRRNENPKPSYSRHVRKF